MRTLSFTLRRAIALTGAGLCLLVASCSAEASDDYENNSSSTLELENKLTPAKSPPGDVPSVDFIAPSGRISGKVVYADWVTAEVARKISPDGVDDAPEVHISEGRNATLKVHANVLPSYAEIITYAGLDNNGIPDGELERLTSNPPPRPASCVLNPDSDRLMVKLTPHQSAAVVIFYASWRVPSIHRSNGEVQLPSEVSASWAFLVES